MAGELTREQAAKREQRTFRRGYWLFFGLFPFGMTAIYIVLAVLASKDS